MHFLEHVAQDIYERRLKGASPEALLQLRLVFPSRRARLFFSHYLSKITTEPLWLPASDSIDTLMMRISGLREANRYVVIAEIYRCFRDSLKEMAAKREIRYLNRDESFEQFFYWGDLMLRDFDALDKYLIEVDPLLRNVSDLKKIATDDLSFLSPEQIRALEDFWDVKTKDKPRFTDFWTNVDTQKKLPDNFCEFWDTLKPTYDRLYTALKARGEGYTGMIYREALRRLDSYDFKKEQFIFIGFGALSECERRLFTKINGISEFYWDWDAYYRDSEVQEAGLFVRQNMEKFHPADEGRQDALYRQFSEPKDISIVAAPSELMQAKILPELLRIDAALSPDNQDTGFPPTTAIVLANENLLIPVLYSLGEAGKGTVNITMGYPLSQTSAYSLIQFVTSLQRNIRGSDASPRFYYKDVLAVITHEYIHALIGDRADALSRTIVERNMAYLSPRRICELLGGDEQMAPVAKLFEKIADYKELLNLLKCLLEAVAAAYKPEGELSEEDASDIDMQRAAISFCRKSLNRLEEALALCGDVELTTGMVSNLLLASLKNERIPFEGEPVSGLQIMGILETRLLDFDNLIILSLNEDIFPSVGNIQSLLPYNLRRAYGLPSVEESEAVNAYTFYRLLQRARRVKLLYNAGGGEQRTGEKSRYLRQLEMESPHAPFIKANSVSASFGTLKANDPYDTKVEKTGAVRAALEEFLKGDGKPSLSPSALKHFMSCPLRFYYVKLLGLQEDKDVDEGADAVLLGNVFHHTMEDFYKPFKDSIITKDKIEAIQADSTGVEKRILYNTAKEIINKNARPDEQSEPTAEDLRNVEDSGEIYLVTEVVKKYVNAMLSFDLRQTPFKLCGVEEEVNHPLTFTDAGGARQTVRLHGIIDRLDEKDGTVRVIDYKTGNYKASNTNKRNAASMETLFARQDKKQRHEIFQTMLYALVKQQNGEYEGLHIAPSLCFLRELSQDGDRGSMDVSIDKEVLTDARPLLDDFTERLQAVLREMFDFSKPFEMTDDPGHCQHCDFSGLCKK